MKYPRKFSPDCTAQLTVQAPIRLTGAMFHAFVLIVLLVLYMAHPVGALEPPAAPTPAGKKAVIVVGRFQRPLGGFVPPDWPEWQVRLQETLLEKLSDHSVNVVDRTRITEVTDELKRVGDTVDAETGGQIGKATGGTHILVGRVSFEVHKDFFVTEYNLVLKGHLISLRTSKTVANFEARKKKKGKFFLDPNEVNEFFEKMLDDTCTEMAAKIAMNPPPAEEALDPGANPQDTNAGMLLVEGDGKAPSQGESDPEAKKAAHADAVRDAVLRYARLLTRSDSQKEVVDLVGDDAGRYAAMEGAPLSETTQGNVCKSTVHVQIYMTKAPEGKLALIPRLRDRGLLQTLKVMVVVPETHIARPRIPDPALETEITRQLIEAGFTCVDQSRIREIRDSDLISKLAHGTVTVDDLARFKTDYGADIMVTGEGISQRAEADRFGQGVRCVARGEIKAYRIDNAEMIFSDAVPGEQATGIAEEITAKNALQNAGKRIAPRIITALFQRGFGHATSVTTNGTTQQENGTLVTLKLTGFQNAAAMDDFLEALATAKNILKVSDQQVEAGILIVKILVKPDAAAKIGFKLPADPAIMKFKLNITTFKGTTLEGTVKK